MKRSGLALLDELAEIDPGPRTSTLIYNVGVERFNAEAAADAERLFRRAVSLDGGHVDAWVGLAEALLRLERWDECLEAIERLRRLRATHPAVERIEERVQARRP